MAWKLRGAAGALLILFGFAGLDALGAHDLALGAHDLALGAHDLPPERSTLRAGYRRPDAIPFPEDNPYAPGKAALGRALFFDPILSGSGTRSCASCHDPDLAWADGRARASGPDGSAMRLRTPSLLNLAWAPGALGWEGKFRSLEAVPIPVITAPGNMDLPEAEAIRRLAARPDSARAFAEAFPGDPAGAPLVTRARIEDALATFVRLVVSGQAPFDRWVAGDEDAIDAAAKRGFDLFNGKANCAACHEGWTFTDGSFHDVGTARGDDIGRGRLFPNSTAARYAFKTPTLRDLARRAPYMHDGSVPTLAAVIDLYDRGGIDRPSRSREIRPLGLTGAEKADLLAFLRTLDGPAGEDPALAAHPQEPPRP